MYFPEFTENTKLAIFLNSMQHFIVANSMTIKNDCVAKTTNECSD